MSNYGYYVTPLQSRLFSHESVIEHVVKTGDLKYLRAYAIEKHIIPDPDAARIEAAEKVLRLQEQLAEAQKKLKELK
jgi:hypothetical protein